METLKQKLKTASALLLDMDGTLLDAEALYIQAREWAAEQMGFCYDAELIRIGHGRKSTAFLDELKSRAGSDFDVTTFQRLQMQYRRENNINAMIRYMPGAEALLKWLKSAGIPSALVTSSGRHHVDKMLVQFPLMQVIDEIVASDDVSHNKPHPEPYLIACQHLNLAPEDCIAIEDSQPGIDSALEAGCQVIDTRTLGSLEKILP